MEIDLTSIFAVFSKKWAYPPTAQAKLISCRYDQLGIHENDTRRKFANKAMNDTAGDASGLIHTLGDEQGKLDLFSGLIGSKPIEDLYKTPEPTVVNISPTEMVTLTQSYSRYSNDPPGIGATIVNSLTNGRDTIIANAIDVEFGSLHKCRQPTGRPYNGWKNFDDPK